MRLLAEVRVHANTGLLAAETTDDHAYVLSTSHTLDVFLFGGSMLNQEQHDDNWGRVYRGRGAAPPCPSVEAANGCYRLGSASAVDGTINGPRARAQLASSHS